MSYTRRYSETVSGSKTIHINYPASEHGGSTSETVTIEIPVNIQIHVETSPFDRSVSHCQRNVDVLTGAVVATGSANVVAIRAGAGRVSDSVIGGFFRLISSELSQQIAEYRAKCDALVLKLRDLKSACLGKMTQMEGDFYRIASHYTELFRDLDNELARRIHAMDAAAFELCRTAAEQTERAISSALSTIPTVLGAEDGKSRAAILTTMIRGRAGVLLEKARLFLAGDRELSRSLHEILSGNGGAAPKDRFLPVIYFLADGSSGFDERLITGSRLRAPAIQTSLLQSFRATSLAWVPLDKQTRSSVEMFLANQVAVTTNGQDPTQARIAAYIVRFWQAQPPLVIRRSQSIEEE